MDNYHFTKKSSNVKIGPIPSTMSTFDNCPDTCAFKDNGCYAQNFIMGSIFKKLTNGTYANILTRKGLIDKLKELKDGQIWRMNTMGDLPVTKKKKIDRNFLRALTSIAKRTKPICYTHHEDVESIKWANENGFPLILSLNSQSELDKYAGVVPTAIVSHPDTQIRKGEDHGDYKKRTNKAFKDIREKHSDQKIFICPATYTDTDCNNCGACSSMSKNHTVCFPSHGAKKNFIKV